MAELNPITPEQALGFPTSSGCPAAHLYLSERRLFQDNVKVPVNAIGRILKVVEPIVSPAFDSGPLGPAGRIKGICMWALLGDESYLTDASDRAALLDVKPASSSIDPSRGATPSAEPPRQPEL